MTRWRSRIRLARSESAQMTRQRVIAWGVLVIVFAAVAGMLATTRRTAKVGEDELPVALVQRGGMDLKVYTTGELRASHAVALIAPPVAGGALQITRLLHTGTPVKKGDIVFEF